MVDTHKWSLHLYVNGKVSRGLFSLMLVFLVDLTCGLELMDLCKTCGCKDLGWLPAHLALTPDLESANGLVCVCVPAV